VANLFHQTRNDSRPTRVRFTVGPSLLLLPRMRTVVLASNDCNLVVFEASWSQRWIGCRHFRLSMYLRTIYMGVRTDVEKRSVFQISKSWSGPSFGKSSNTVGLNNCLGSEVEEYQKSPVAILEIPSLLSPQSTQISRCDCESGLGLGSVPGRLRQSFRSQHSIYL